MADTLNIVTFSRGGRPVTELDIENGTTIQKLRDSFRYQAAAAKQQVAQADRRFGGGRVVGESHENGQATATWMVSGTTADLCIQAVETLLAEVAEVARGRYLKFKPDGASYPTYWELRGPATWDGKYRWVTFAGAQVMIVDLTFPVAPLAEWDRMDIWDDFAIDTESDYTILAGSAASVSVANGTMSVDANEPELVHTARGYTYGDTQAIGKFEVSATAGAPFAGVLLKRSGATWLRAFVVSGGGLNLQTQAGTSLASTGSVTFPTSTPFWIVGRIEGNVVTLEYWTSEPTPMGTPTTTLTHVLSTVNAAIYGAAVQGSAGLYGRKPTGGTLLVHDFKIEPFTWRTRTLPERLDPAGSIPGDAPALVEAQITPSGSTAAPIFALLTWAEKPPAHNLVWNGDFEDDTNGWGVAAVSGVTGAATSVTRTTTASKVKYGAAAAEIVTPATANTGATFPIYRKFRKGTVYTVVVWARSAADTTNTRVRLGVSGDLGSETATALSSTYTQRTTTWTPTADVDVAYVAFEVTAATATTMQIDGVQVYEGTTAPTVGRHTEGEGGYPPFGILEAEACDTGDLSTWAQVTDANYRTGFGIRATTSGAGSAAAMWTIDPNLMVADDFTDGEIDIEVWARVELDGSVVTPKLTVSTRPEGGTNYGSERTGSEWGSAGKSLVRPSSGARFRRVRLDTVTMRVDRDRPVRWKLRLAGSWAASSSGVFGVDFLELTVKRRRACSPTAKANDSAYPKFVASTSETVKTITSDLKGLIAKPGRYAHPDHGLSGEKLWFPFGNVTVLCDLSSLAPDDPTSDTTSEAKDYPATVHLAVVPRSQWLRGS